METTKRLFRLGLLFMFFCGLTFMVLLIFRDRRAVAKNYSSFKFYDLNNHPFPATMLIPGKAVIILFADPGCDICLTEVRQIANAMESIPAVEVIVVVSGSLKQAGDFSRNCPIPKASLFRFVYDKDQVFTFYFGMHSTPSLFILDKNHKLAKRFQGETSVSSVIAAVNHINH